MKTSGSSWAAEGLFSNAWRDSRMLWWEARKAQKRLSGQPRAKENFPLAE